jgi:Tfp pilus assembly protein FimT
MVEMAVSLTVLLILTAVAIPTLMRSFRAYQLNDAAARVSDMLKFTRFEAVRRNTTVNFVIVASGTNWLAGTDSNGDGTLQTTEKQTLISGIATIVPSGTAPGSATIVANLGSTGSLTPISGATTVTFDARGAVSPLTAYILYLGSLTNPEFGYRAVVLLPSGATQVWSAPNGGTWQRIG